MDAKGIITKIKKEKPEIKSVYYVGCGASKAELYPGKYFLEENAKTLRVGHFTANEFVHATPAAVDGSAIVIACTIRVVEFREQARRDIGGGCNCPVGSHGECRVDQRVAAHEHNEVIWGLTEIVRRKCHIPSRVLDTNDVGNLRQLYHRVECERYLGSPGVGVEQDG